VLNMSRWAQRGDMWEASDMMHQMRQEGFTPDIHSYTSFINACCKGGDMQVCETCSNLVKGHNQTDMWLIK
jgi:pentatricopeptide repeat protein